MHSSLLGARSCAATALAVVALAAAPARAADTALQDEPGILRIDAPGKWRAQDSDRAIHATGFLGGVKRSELFAVVYDDLRSAAAAARRWKDERAKEGDEPQFTHSGDELRFTAHSASKGIVDYVRALDGADRSAVVWVRLNGAPGAADAAAEKLLDGARLEEPEPEKPAAGDGGDEAGDGPAAPAGGVHKDPDFRVQVVLPESFRERRDVEPEGRRVLTLIGPVGTDEESFFDMYVFDHFERADACGKWWQEQERMGWRQGLAIQGDVLSFKIEVEGETWTRHVRILDTEAGVVGLKLDAASQAEKAATELLDRVRGSLQVLKPRPAVPTPPPGMRALTSEKSILQHELPEGSEKAKALLFQADVVEDHVAAIAGVPAPAGRKAVLRSYADATALANALRPLGITDGRAAHWWPREGAVLTHAGALGKAETTAALRMELTRASLQRRLGFRAPFWIERGIGHMVASAAFNKGRVDQPHPGLVRAVGDAAPIGCELQSVRWWTHDDSAARPERGAIAWSYIHFFLNGGSAGRKYEESYRTFMQRLHASGDPVEAAEAFDFARETEMADDWQQWAQKL